MRSLWLATSAVLLSTGLAFAQTSSPAPTGAPTAPTVTPPGASPGNMGSNAGSSTTNTMGPSASSATPSAGTATSSPAPNGAINAPHVTSASPGKTAPTPVTPSASMSAMSTPSKPMHHHWYSPSMTLPEDASASTYLHIARSAIRHHDISLADDALSHAETRLLDRAVPQGQIAADDDASIQSIESARKALHSGDYSTAASDTKQAANTVSGM